MSHLNSISQNSSTVNQKTIRRIRNMNHKDRHRSTGNSKHTNHTRYKSHIMYFIAFTNGLSFTFKQLSLQLLALGAQKSYLRGGFESTMNL